MTLQNNNIFDWRIDASGEGVEICRYVGREEELEVPEELDGLPVTSILEGYLREGFDNLPGLERYKGVFSDDRLLRSVCLHSAVSRIPSFAFRGCDNLEKITLPPQLKEIGDYAFEDCDAMVEWLLPESLEKIGVGAFIGSDSVAKVVLHNNLREIGAKAFAGCGSLEEVVLPESLESIGEDAFDPKVKLIVVSGSEAEKWAKRNGRTYELQS